MRRREFLAGLLLGAMTPCAQAQQPTKAPRIAVVHPSNSVGSMSETGQVPYWPAFFAELRRLGYIEGQNLVIERYSGEGQTHRYAELAERVVRSNPDLITTVGTDLVRHFEEATTTIPIVAFTTDPIALKLVASLARPGGNITGISNNAGIEIWGKRLELLKEAVPKLSGVALLTDRKDWEDVLSPVLQDLVQHVGVTLSRSLLDSPVQESEFRRVFAALEREHVDALIVSSSAVIFPYRHLIVELAEKARLPAIYPDRTFAEAGGLLSYGPDFTDLFRRAANKVVQILKGAKPEEIPFEQPTKFELVVNLKAAKAIGLGLPSAFLANADEVIE